MQEYSQEEKIFMYFNVYLQGGDVPEELKTEFAEFELARTGLPQESISDESNSGTKM